MITINNVFKRYGQNLVLNNISLKLPRTGLIAIEGPSGCGKTTLFPVDPAVKTVHGIFVQ